MSTSDADSFHADPRSEVMKRDVQIRLRVRTEDSAFLYQVLESHEGLASYSTVTTWNDIPNGEYRIVELSIPHILEPVTRKLIQTLGTIVQEVSVEG
jgi:hypothetical protein